MLGLKLNHVSKRGPSRLEAIALVRHPDTCIDLASVTSRVDDQTMVCHFHFLWSENVSKEN